MKAIRPLAVMAAILVPSVVTASAEGDRASDRKVQTRYAQETSMMSAAAFVDRQNDFRAHGCKNRWPEIGSPRDKPTWFGCDKPPPYNWFDWTDDGCSKTPPPAMWVFRSACRQHDFGYRNFGKGLTLERTEERRAWIDARFLAEMYRICSGFGASTGTCRAEARVMWSAVRRFNDWRD